MITDAPPRKKNRKLFTESDRVNTLGLPTDDRLRRIGTAIEAAIEIGRTPGVLAVSREFLDTAADFYQVKHCNLRVLEARPLRVKERSTLELFGDYHPDTILIRVWMKTAVRKEVTSFGTFLSTLCHEFCHHLDFQRYPDSWHTRGFVAADDMPPSMFLTTDWRDGGLVLRRGSPSSHVAILARSRGVPMIVGVDVDHLENGKDAMLDGDAGLLSSIPIPICGPSTLSAARSRRTFGRRLARSAALHLPRAVKRFGS